MRPENSPALQCWEPRPPKPKSPAGTKEPFCRPCRDFAPMPLPFPSDESLGYCQHPPPTLALPKPPKPAPLPPPCQPSPTNNPSPFAEEEGRRRTRASSESNAYQRLQLRFDRWDWHAADCTSFTGHSHASAPFTFRASSHLCGGSALIHAHRLVTTWTRLHRGCIHGDFLRPHRINSAAL